VKFLTLLSSLLNLPSLIPPASVRFYLPRPSFLGLSPFRFAPSLLNAYRAPRLLSPRNPLPDPFCLISLGSSLILSLVALLLSYTLLLVFREAICYNEAPSPRRLKGISFVFRSPFSLPLWISFSLKKVLPSSRKETRTCKIRSWFLSDKCLFHSVLFKNTLTPPGGGGSSSPPTLPMLLPNRQLTLNIKLGNRFLRMSSQRTLILTHFSRSPLLDPPAYCT